jgi:hypothetical protein
MKNPGFARDQRGRLGVPSSETVKSLRLLKGFVKLSPEQRSEAIDLIERLATDPSPSRGPAPTRHDARRGRPDRSLRAGLPVRDMTQNEAARRGQTGQTLQRRDPGNMVTLNSKSEDDDHD